MQQEAKREVRNAEFTTKNPTRLGVGLLCIVSQASYVAGEEIIPAIT